MAPALPSGHETRLLEVGRLGRVLMRPISPDDEEIYRRFFDKVTLDDRRLRLFVTMSVLTQDFVERMTHVDNTRDVAFIAVAPNTGEMLGVARYALAPDLKTAEYGVLVRSDLKGRGLGWVLMRHLIDVARARGLSALTGFVLAENGAMLRMCDELGFTRQPHTSDLGVVEVRLDLAAPATGC